MISLSFSDALDHKKAHLPVQFRGTTHASFNAPLCLGGYLFYRLFPYTLLNAETKRTYFPSMAKPAIKPVAETSSPLTALIPFLGL